MGGTRGGGATVPFTVDEIEAWRVNPRVNPRTKRPIVQGKEVHNMLKHASDTLDRAATMNGSIDPNIDEGENNVIAPTASTQVSNVIPTDVALVAHVKNVTNATNVTNVTSTANRTNPVADTVVAVDRQAGVISSRALLRQFRATADVPSPYREAMDHHFEMALGSYDAPFPLFRSIEDVEAVRITTPPLPYAVVNSSPSLRKLTITNCHDGQRKLTMALLDFLSTSFVRLECAPKDVIVVYAGASGLASAVASTVFPDLRMLLFDPHPNTLSHMPPGFQNKIVFKDTYHVLPSLYNKKKLTIFTGAAGWFDDETATFCRETVLPSYAGAKHLLFVSDVRSDTGELDIARDMRNQMRWTVLTGCSAYMHKFKIPYTDDPDAQEVLRMYRDLSDVPQDCLERRVQDPGTGTEREPVAGKRKDAGPKNETIPYLDGKLHVQVYGPQRTAELRLVGFPIDPKPTLPLFRYQKKVKLLEAKTNKGTSVRNDVGNDKKYVVREYDMQDIEDRMATFNVFYRGHARFASDHMHDDGDDAMYLPATYEVVAERAILMRCASVMVMSTKPFTASLVATTFNKMRSQLKSGMSSFTIKDPLVCSLISAAAEMKKHRLSPSVYAPHVLEWAAQILHVRPDATIPAELRPR
jgi:hypothetical protein